jgi:hypothetical protein
VLGNEAGSLVLVVLVVLVAAGVGPLVQRSVVIFTVLKLAGAGTWSSPGPGRSSSAAGTSRPPRAGHDRARHHAGGHRPPELTRPPDPSSFRDARRRDVRFR